MGICLGGWLVDREGGCSGLFKNFSKPSISGSSFRATDGSVKRNRLQKMKESEDMTYLLPCKISAGAEFRAFFSGGMIDDVSRSPTTVVFVLAIATVVVVSS